MPLSMTTAPILSSFSTPSLRSCVQQLNSANCLPELRSAKAGISRRPATDQEANCSAKYLRQLLKIAGSLPASYPQSVMKIILSKTPRIEFHFVLKVSSEAFPIKPSDDSPRISSFDGKATLRGSAT